MTYIAQFSGIPLFAATPVMSQDSVDHYAPQPSETLDAALRTFRSITPSWPRSWQRTT